jgi:NAD(P)-dependent dehydrogenase (short-subunit alcohol dehydrogenase family)
VLALPGDIADAAHRADLVAMAWTRGGLDLLVNNASVLGPSPLPKLADHPLDALEEIYRVNVVAPIGLFQEAAFLLRSTGGSVVNITSDAAVEAYETWGGYGSSKAALEQATRIIAAEEPDLRVWTFDPGDMRTQMHQDAFPGEDISDRPEPETVLPALRALIDRRPPSGRYRSADLLMEVVS